MTQSWVLGDGMSRPAWAREVLKEALSSLLVCNLLNCCVKWRARPACIWPKCPPLPHPQGISVHLYGLIFPNFIRNVELHVRGISQGADDPRAHQHILLQPRPGRVGKGQARSWARHASSGLGQVEVISGGRLHRMSKGASQKASRCGRQAHIPCPKVPGPGPGLRGFLSIGWDTLETK